VEVKWDRRYAKPLSDGGATICEKHDFIESNFRDPDMEYEVCEAIAQAKDDGKRMEARLQELGEECNNLEDHANDYDEISAELRRLRISQPRRMADVAMYGTCGSIRDLDRWRRFADACLAEIERLRGEG
jgi:hypothetical protein